MSLILERRPQKLKVVFRSIRLPDSGFRAFTLIEILIVLALIIGLGTAATMVAWQQFDAAKAGWKKGLTPFGSLGGKLEPLGQCDRNICGCGEKPRTLWENEVLLIRGTFDIPPLKQGHRYRIVVGGSAHVSAGEGFAIYVDGKPFASSKSGVGKRQGAQPRGGHVYADFRDEFSDGKVSIAVMSFLRYNHPRIKPYPPRGHLTVWLEEQQVPPLLSRN